MSCPGRTGATTRPAPIRGRSPAPSPEPKVRCLSPRLVDEDVVMYECEEAPASVRVAHATMPEPTTCLPVRSVAAASDQPVTICATAPTVEDTQDHEEPGEEWEEWEEEEEEEEEDEDEDEEDGKPAGVDAPRSATGSHSSNLFNNCAKPPSPPPRAAPIPAPLRFERPFLPPPPPAYAAGKVKIEDEDENDASLWKEPSRVPVSQLQHPGRPCSTGRCLGSAGVSKDCPSSRAGTPLAGPASSDRDHRDTGSIGEISITLATGTETANLELHLTPGSTAASKEHSAAPTSEPTFDLKVTAKGPGRVSISAAWRGLGHASASQTP